jgi:hypothetical protein
LTGTIGLCYDSTIELGELTMQFNDKPNLKKAVELVMQGLNEITPQCKCGNPGCADNRRDALETAALKYIDSYTATMVSAVLSLQAERN